jgi:hypothetical protein
VRYPNWRSTVPTGGTEERRFVAGRGLSRSGVPEFRALELRNASCDPAGWITRHAVRHPAIGAAVAGLPVEIQLLEVRGHPAVRTRRFLIWDEAPGVQVQLSGEKDLATLVRIAESFVPVPADPRIKNP